MSFCTLSFFIPTSQEGRLKGKTWQESEKEESGERRKTVEQAPQEWIMRERRRVRPHRIAERSEVSYEPMKKTCPRVTKPSSHAFHSLSGA